MNRLFSRGHAFLVVCMVFSCGLALGQRFSRSPATLTGVYNGEILFADFNNDNHLDLFVSGYTDIFTASSAVIYRGDGQGHLTPAATLPTIPSGAISLEDYNRDGLVDILMVAAEAGTFDEGTLLYENKVNFVFEKVNTGLPASNTNLASFGDFDNDGDADVVALGGSFHDIFQNTDGTFSGIDLNKLPSSSFGYSSAVQWGDYDADGDGDYIVANGYFRKLLLYKNNGFDQFQTIEVLTDFNTVDVEWANINNDGLLDLVVVGSDVNAHETFHILINNGDGSFQPLNNSIMTLSEGDILPIDIDQDGDTDLILAGYSYEKSAYVTMLYTNVNGSFTMSQSGLPMLEEPKLAAADVDHDNDLDIVISGGEIQAQVFVFGKTYLYINNGLEKNTRPQPPASSSVEVSGQKARVTWDAATDAQTPAGGLSYNVYLGTAPSVYNILRPMATNDAVTATTFGNAGFNRFRIIDNLLPGTYYYRLQTIDGSQGVSVRSAEKQFTIIPSAPVIEGFTPSVAMEGDTVYVTGINFIQASAVSINEVPATFKVISSSSIRVIVPAVRHSGHVKVVTPRGTAVSSETFCEKPKSHPIYGITNPCFGDVEYEVPFISGITYHWSVDNGASVISQSNGRATIRFPKNETYHIKVYPESCTTGEETSVTVTTKGPVVSEIGGSRDVLTEVNHPYFVSHQYNHGFTWFKDNVQLPNLGYNTVDIIWREVGVHELKVHVTNNECPASIAESVAQVSVSLNQVSYVKNIAFSNTQDFSPGMLLADLDSDGDDDMLLGRTLLENTGGTLVPRTSFSTDDFHDITPIDIDNDNDVDLLVQTNDLFSAANKLFVNNGGFNFVETSSVPHFYSSLPELLAIDYDLDGKTDVAMGSKIYPNNQAGFVNPKLLLNEIEYNSNVAFVCDFNNDGYPDVLGSDQLQINGGDGGGKFIRDNTWSNRPPIHISDLDRDGAYDFVYRPGDRTKAIFSGNAGIAELGADDMSIRCFLDINLDGYTDIIGTSNEAWIYQPLLKEYKKAFEFSAINWLFNSLDLDNDGVDELMYLEGSILSGLFHVYKNNHPHPAPITPPTGLNSTTGNLTVDLYWDKVAGYTYNVVVGSSVGSTNIVSPLANVTTGEGFIRSIGNAGINNFFKLNLPAGTYHWSVQAVSANGTRSKFSDWKSFVTEAQTTAPSNLALTIKNEGVELSWDDNAPNETGFVIERKFTTTAFTTIGTVGPNTETFVDPVVNYDIEVFYRVSATIPPDKKLSSKTASTSNALIKRFHHYENFESPVSYPGWGVMASDNFGSLWGPYWKRVALFNLEGSYLMQSLSSSHAIVTPEFDLTGMEYPVVKFYTQHQPPISFSEQPVRIEGSQDGGETWTNLGYGNFWQIMLGNRQMAYTYPSAGTGRIRFRIRNDLELMIDEFVVVDAPQITTGQTLTQTAQNEIRLDWNVSQRATHYLVGRAIKDQPLTLTYDTVAAPLHTYVDRNLTTPNTYQYLVHAINIPAEAFAYEYGGWTELTLANLPISLQSIDPVTMQVGEHKEISLGVHSATTPLEDLTMTVTSSNPALQGILSFVQSGQSIKLVIASNGSVGQSVITVTAADQSLSDSKSFNLSVHTETSPPTADTPQKFCYDPTVASLVASGSFVKWYSTPTGGTPLSASALLANNSHYYGSQTLNGLESNSRVDVTVTFGVAPPTGSSTQTLCSGATIADIVVSGTAVKWYNDATDGALLSSLAPLTNNKHYYATQTIDGCESKSRLEVVISIKGVAPTGLSVQNLCPDATVANLVVSGTGIKWYSTSAGGSPLLATTVLTNGNNYYASQTSDGCESKERLKVTAIIGVPTAPTGTPGQTFCEGATIGNLAALGTSVKWYQSSAGGSSLPTTTVLTNGSHYFATQTTGSCESQSRLEITVTVRATAGPTGAITQTFCSATVQNLVATGTALKWYTSEFGGSSLSSTTALTHGSSYYASQTLTGCESLSRLKVTVSINDKGAPAGDSNQAFCTTATVADLLATGTGIKWYTAVSGGSLFPTSTTLVDGLSYYASQTVNNCESATRLRVTVSTGGAIAPTGNAAQSFCSGATIGNLAATGTNIKWYDSAFGGLLLQQGVLLENGRPYFASQNVNGCESSDRFKVTATIVPIPAPPVGQSSQTFVQGKTVADLVVTGTNIKWYWTMEDAQAAIANLSLQTPLIDKTYFATQKPSLCVSAPLAVTVTISDVVIGITEPLEDRIKLYPNPVRDDLLITFDGTIDRVVILNALGQEVIAKHPQSSAITFDMSAQAAGVYTVQINLAEKIVIWRVLKL